MEDTKQNIEAMWSLLEAFLEEQKLLTKEVSQWLTDRDHSSIKEWRLGISNHAVRNVLDTFCNGIECNVALSSLQLTCDKMTDALFRASEELEKLDEGFAQLDTAHHALGDSLAALQEWVV